MGDDLRLRMCHLSKGEKEKVENKIYFGEAKRSLRPSCGSHYCSLHQFSVQEVWVMVASQVAE